MFGALELELRNGIHPMANNLMKKGKTIDYLLNTMSFECDYHEGFLWSFMNPTKVIFN